MQEAEADLEKLRIMGLAIAGLRIALAAVWTRGGCKWEYVGMSVGSLVVEEKVGSSRLERSNVARREEQSKIVLPLWHWHFAYNRPRANSTDTGASHFRCGLVICIVRGAPRIDNATDACSSYSANRRYRGTGGGTRNCMSHDQLGSRCSCSYY